MLCGACIPGKFAGRIEGVVIDKKSSKAVAGARLVSTIPHRERHSGPNEALDVTDENGRFSFGPEYGIFKLLTRDADWREIAISREGYEGTKVSIMHSGSKRYVTYGMSKHTTEMPRKEPLQIKLKKK